MNSELIDEARYLANRNDLLKLLQKVYGDDDVSKIISDYELILVGGQALALWHYQYFDMVVSRDVHYSFSDDIDFYGLKVSLQFITEKLRVEIKTPDNFDPTVNLGVFTIPSKSNDKGLIVVDIIHSVGGLERKDILQGVEIANINDLELPVINPVLCLKSRMHNFNAKFKADKVKELYRVDIAIRCSKSYINEELDAGWSKSTSRLIETIIEMSNSIAGCDMFIKHGVDLMQAIDLTHPNINEKFLTHRHPKALAEIESNREKRTRHLERFNSFDPLAIKELSIETGVRRFEVLSNQVKPLGHVSFNEYLAEKFQHKTPKSKLDDPDP